MTLYLLLSLMLAAVLAVLLSPIAQARQRLALLLGGLIGAGAFGLFGLFGTPQILPLLDARQENLATLRHNIVRHSEAVKADPKNTAAWVRLGQDFAEAEEWPAAANAFKQAVKLSGGDPALIMAYAKSLILSEDGQVNAHAKKSLEMVLVQQPENAEAKYFLAVQALQEGKTEAAMREMKALYRSLPEDSPLKDAIDRQIGRK